MLAIIPTFKSNFENYSILNSRFTRLLNLSKEIGITRKFVRGNCIVNPKPKRGIETIFLLLIF